MATKTYSIKAAASALGLSEVYIRRMIQHGKLATTKVQVGDTEVWRHEIAEAELNKWRKSSSTRTQREDGRNKFVMYATSDELAKIQKLLAANNVHAVIERANKPEETKKRYAKMKAKRLLKKSMATTI